MRAVLMAFLCTTLSGVLRAQPVDTLTLTEGYRKAQEAAPLKKQYALNNSTANLAIINAESGNLPSVSSFGKAWYQSDAVTTPSFGPGMEGLSIDRFQYNFGVEVNQKLFDGGAVLRQKKLEESSLDVNNAALDANLYQLNDQVNHYFFSILLMKDAEQLLDSKKKTLQERAKSLASGVENGMILQSELEKIEVEIMAVEQQQIDLAHSIRSLEGALKVITGIPENTAIVLQKPKFVELSHSPRPEHQFFDARQHQLENMKALKSLYLMPKVSAYAQLGYSYPGLNFFENQSDTYYMVGGRFSWALFDWGKTKKEKEILEVDKQKIEVQRDDFERNLSVAATTKSAEILKLEELISKDREIIEKRENITRASASALENGAITSATYLEDLNAEIRSRLDLQKHKTELLKARAEIAVIKGISIE